VINDLVPDPDSGTPESPYSADEVRLMLDAADAIKRLHDAGFLLVAASNQPAAAKGIASTEQLQAVHNRIVELLAREGAALDDWRYCFHHPDFTGPCDCRKPEPGMLLDAATEHDIDLSGSWMWETPTETWRPAAERAQGRFSLSIPAARTAARARPATPSCATCRALWE